MDLMEIDDDIYVSKNLTMKSLVAEGTAAQTQTNTNSLFDFLFCWSLSLDLSLI